MSSVNTGEVTLEAILGAENLQRACKQVIRNKGSAGIDGMKVNALRIYRKVYPHEVAKAILDGSYQPQPIRRVYIPKDNGERRPLGIPTVMDRFVQQAAAQVLSNYYEKEFSDNSFGFRPKRCCRDAVKRATEYLNSGYVWVIDLDLAKFFDTVNHSKLLQVLSNRIKDGRVISLIHKFLRAPVCENGIVGPKTMIGTPQGGCISPVLANILLNELDQYLDKLKTNFVRYADDMCVFCGSKKAAERKLRHIKRFIEKKLFLKVNETKTKIVKAGPQVQFLGFSFTIRVGKKRRRKHPKRKWFPTVHRKKRSKLREALKILLDRKAPKGIKATKVSLERKVRGWCNYFKGCIPTSWMKAVDGWMRRRIRQIYWKQWKTKSRRFREIKKLWPNAPPLEEYAYSSNSYWRMSKTPQIHKAMSVNALFEAGWVWLSLFEVCGI